MPRGRGQAPAVADTVEIDGLAHGDGRQERQSGMASQQRERLTVEPMETALVTRYSARSRTAQARPIAASLGRTLEGRSLAGSITSTARAIVSRTIGGSRASSPRCPAAATGSCRRSLTGARLSEHPDAYGRRLHRLGAAWRLVPISRSGDQGGRVWRRASASSRQSRPPRVRYTRSWSFLLEFRKVLRS